MQLTVVPEMEDEEGDAAETESAGEDAGAGEPVALVLARDRDHVDDTLQTLVVGLTASACLVSLLGVLVVAHTVKWGLEPLASVTKDIPVLGWLFKNFRVTQDYEELMVFITPRTLMGGASDLPNAEQLWRKAFSQTEGNRPLITPGPAGP